MTSGAELGRKRVKYACTQRWIYGPCGWTGYRLGPFLNHADQQAPCPWCGGKVKAARRKTR